MGSSTENNGIDVKTTDSGYMSPPEAHLDTELHENQAQDSVCSQLSELHLGQKSPVRESELETYNSFNYWRVPLPSIGDEGSAGAAGSGNTDLDKTSENANSGNPSEDEASDDSKDTSGAPTTGQSNDEVEPGEETKPSEEANSSEESTTPRLEFQDLGISDMDIDCDDVEKNDLTWDETVNDSPKRMEPLSGIPTLRFDEDYMQPYSPSMCFDDEANRVPSPPQSPRHSQVSIISCLALCKIVLSR